MNPIQARPDQRVFIVAAGFTAAFAAPCAYAFFKKSDPTALIIVGIVMGFVFLNLSRIRFECTDSVISYTSLLKRQTILIQDIVGVRIGYPHDTAKAPKFIVKTRSQGEVVLEVRALPLAAVQESAKRLVELGVSFSIDQESRARRMAEQILARTQA